MRVRQDLDLVPVQGVPDFWARWSDSGHRLLGLDYDGTLAPFHVDPMQAAPLPGISEAVEALRDAPNTEVVIVSGRPVAEVAHLLGNLDITMIGGHGYERKDRDGTLRVTRPAALQLEGLKTARSLILKSRSLGRLEGKVASLALHTRGLPAETAREVEEETDRQWRSLAPAHHLEVRRFNGGVEIRSLGRQKGDAFRDIMVEQPPDALVVYVGDDETDEDVFRLIRHRGVGIRVGDPSAPTAARGFLRDCLEVRRFLAGCLGQLPRKSH